MIRLACVLVVVLLVVGLYRGWYNYTVNTSQVQSDAVQVQKAVQEKLAK